MDEITHSQCVQDVLHHHGRLATAIPGFVARAPQIQLADAIARVIAAKGTLVAEAGTGTGKTFAYLIPCLLHGKKALISTATKTLQDQLFQKDLPLLTRALGLALRVQNLKGRSNYLCRYRTELHAQTDRLLGHQTLVNTIVYVREKLPQLIHGDRSELPEIAEDSPVWPYVTSTTDNCLGLECEHYQSCFLVKARRRALDADVVIVNHHLYFAAAGLKEEGFAELLPGVDTVVFDEAHQLADIATQFYGERVSTRQLCDLMDDMLREWPLFDLANQPIKQLRVHLDQTIDQLLLAFPTHAEKVAWDTIARQKAFLLAYRNILQHLDAVKQCFLDAYTDDASDNDNTPEKAGMLRCYARLRAFIAFLEQVHTPDKTHMRWIERFKHSLVFHRTPFDIADLFKTAINNKQTAYIFTSATLTMAGSFDCFTQPLGLTEAQTLLLASPFDLQTQALLYLPRSLPDPHAVDYYPALIARVLPVLHALGGRCFFLFTSHRALKQVAELLNNTVEYPLLVQGEESKAILLARFRQLGNAVLLGTSTFWEGVDVKGEALSCVIIDKIPFASPNDPVICGKLSWLKSRGLSGFDALSLPSAVIALKQGVGRLIRDASDRGVLMLADPRLTSREYGRYIFASLPHVPKTRDEQRVLAFIHENIKQD